jgi:TPP-dependent pyruvate/acetoin dehydrogenase alpha subunit
MTLQPLSSSSPTPELAIEMYRKMRRIRRFEERVIELVNANEIAGVTHEYIGEEAIAVGICSALRESDVITSTHRGHGHIIAKGGEVHRMMAELLGRVTGYNRGKGGSMHIADLALGIYGANGIVAAGAPIAAGAAWAAKIKHTETAAVTFFGDGGANQGVLHETMNMAGIWKLPILFVCENNQYAVTTPASYSTAGPGICERAAAYGFPGVRVDGMKVDEVFAMASEAVRRARTGGGPTLIECDAYRFQGHFTAERALNLTYRQLDEIAAWRLRDPLLYWSEELAKQEILTPEARAAIDAELEEELEAAVAFARESAWPQEEDALADMYVVEYPGLPAKGVAWNAN